MTLPNYDQWLLPPDESAYELAWERWAETGPAERQYAARCEDGELPLQERVCAEPVTVSFLEWLDTSQADQDFEEWYEDDAP